MNLFYDIYYNKMNDMINYRLLISLLLVSQITLAQITISSTDMPDGGDSILVSVNASVGSADPTLTGAGSTWDYSTLVPSIQRFEKYRTPNDFISPFNLLFNQFNTSYGKDNYSFTTLSIPGVQIDAAYDFYKESGADFRQIGGGFSLSGLPLPFLYTSSDIMYRFPLNYLNTDSCIFQYGLPVPSIGYYGRTAKRLNNVDGWGTLITPYGTFQTLRIKSIITATDTLYSSALNLGYSIPQPLKYEFKWLATGMKIPVLQIDANDIGGSLIVTNVVYLDSMRTGVPQVGITEINEESNYNIQLFPNPANDNVFFSYTLKETNKVRISILNVLGENLYTTVDEVELKGGHTQQLNVDDLAKGIYFIELKVDNKSQLRKLIIN